jgi:hypothetical protein
MLCAVLDELPYQPPYLQSLLGVLAVEHNAHNVICVSSALHILRRRGRPLTHLTHTDGESANEVESSLGKSALCNLVLQLGVLARNLGNRREEEVRTIRQPAIPVTVNY